MAGIYIHIPFCRKLCYYCDFHFSVSLKLKERLVAGITRELGIRSSEVKPDQISTIYFGGGTPSVLSLTEIQKLFQFIFDNYSISPDAEISFEANPDDLTTSFLSDLKNYSPINRLSIGIQSFHDRHLQLMNRRHTAQDAMDSIERVKRFGFDNLNIDLIYGIPGMSVEEWKENLKRFNQFKIPHLSAYHLGIEPKTVFAYYQKKGKLRPVDEEVSIKHFNILLDNMEQMGYEHYEISNFALPGQYSKHNLSYWLRHPYLGFGPSAHSCSKGIRRWNVSNNSKYVEALENKADNYFEIESIDSQKAFNEYILTSLRTKWGLDTKFMIKQFGRHKLQMISDRLRSFQEEGILETGINNYCLTRKGKLIADYVISELMLVE